MTHIEKSEQGFTMSKTLAWAFFVAVVSAGVGALGGGMKVGATLTEINARAASTEKAVGELRGAMQSELDRMGAALAAERVRRDEISIRLNSLERTSARDEARAGAIASEVKHVREDLRATRQELAEILRILRGNP